MLGVDGRVSECTGENLFIVRDGVVVTPPTSEAGALSGVTLASVVHIARDLGYTVSFEALRRDDLYVADEAFLTGTAAEVVPIHSVDDRLVGDGEPGPITRALQSTYFRAVRGELPQYEGWLTRVDLVSASPPSPRCRRPARSAPSWPRPTPRSGARPRPGCLRPTRLESTPRRARRRPTPGSRSRSPTA